MTPLRVLLVEDSATDAKLVAQELHGIGRPIEIERVETAGAMRAALEEKKWDVVISDWSMPKFGAPAALALLKEKRLDLPFIIVSGTIGEDTAADAMRSGAHDYVLKDKLGRLVPAVERELRECKERVARRLAEDALRLSERRFRGFKESGIIGIVLSDTAGKIKEANDAFLSIVGYTQADLLAGKVSGQTVNTPERDRTDAAARTELQSKGIAHAWEKELLRKDGSRVPVLMGVVMLEESTQESVAFVLDLTERKRAEAAIGESELLRRQKEAAQAANRELEAFSYSVAHDLRAPLRAISGFSTALRDDYGNRLEDGAKTLIQRVVTNAERMAQMIDALLSLARLSRTDLRRETVDLTQMARDVLEQLRMNESNREVEGVVSEGVVAQGDPKLLRLALENLLGNAWKFTRKKSAARIEFGCTPLADGLVYFVRDNGAGFDSAQVGRLFAPFQRLHSAKEFEGTGVGLATVQRIVERHGGRVWADANENVGATFQFTLPEKPSTTGGIS